jgi:hypothetical protein
MAVKRLLNPIVTTSMMFSLIMNSMNFLKMPGKFNLLSMKLRVLVTRIHLRIVIFLTIRVTPKCVDPNVCVSK